MYRDFSESENSFAAKQAGRFPASLIAKRLGRGYTAADVVAVLSPCEWHHTSSRFNATDFFDLSDLGDIENRRALRAARAARLAVKKTEIEITTGVDVSGETWEGSRNYGRFVPFNFENCAILKNGGSMITIVTPAGEIFSKKADGKHINFSRNLRPIYF